MGDNIKLQLQAAFEVGDWIRLSDSRHQRQTLVNGEVNLCVTRMAANSLRKITTVCLKCDSQ
jgi:hypothetical protein